MFYRVTILEKSDNHREMIVKADSKEAAVAQIPAAKAFLFPSEDTSEYIAFPSKVHLDVMSAKVPHWRITVIRPTEPCDGWEECEPGTMEMTLEAESEEDAIRQAKEEIKCPAEFYAREISAEELIAEEEISLRYRIKEDYIFAKYGDVSVREFNRLMREQINGEKNRFYYDALQFFLGKTRLRNALERSIDLEKISAAEYNALISRLPLANDRTEFEIILNEAKEKYGKAVEA
jgi:hypothetical protein